MRGTFVTGFEAQQSFNQ